MVEHATDAPAETTEPDDGRAILLALLQRVAAGDRGAFNVFYQRTSAKTFALLRRILPTGSQAEDAMQDVYLSVWRSAGSFDPARGVSPVTWLVTIARNKALDRLRAARPAKLLDGDDAIMESVPDGRPTPHQLLEDADVARHLHTCLDRLDAHQSAAIRRAFFEGVTYDELARQTGVPIGTMKSWIRRGLLRLRDCIDS